MKPPPTRRAPLAALAAIALAALAVGCGGDDEQSTRAVSGNAADAAFVADMTPHHEAAVEMAGIAQDQAQRVEIRTLADDIVAAQKREIATMRSLRDELPEAEAGNGHMGMSEEEMGMDMDPAMLKDAKPFDRAFIDMMVPHHRGAVAMAEQLLEQGTNPELRRMAEDIIDAQNREIDQMRAWRKAWYGSAGRSGDHDH